jgi:hypothetical protein
MADRLGVESIDREGRSVVLKFRPRTKVDPGRLVTMVRGRSDLRLVPPAALKLELDEAPRVGEAAAPLRPPARKAGTRADVAPSWWTARARTGEVRPGFSKHEVLRAKPVDPRGAGGVFERVGGLLSELLDQI